jgi:hypothetical protein
MKPFIIKHKNSIFGCIVTLISFYIFKWTPKDLVWGFWLSSLLTGYSFILLLSWKPVFKSKDSIQAIFNGIGALFYTGFFSIHFVGFHFGHSIFLSSFFPLDSVSKNPFENFFYNFSQVFLLYWPVALGTFIDKWDQFKNIGAIGRDSILIPYKGVIKIHLMIFVIGFLSMVQSPTLTTVLSVILLIVFYIIP